jgi:hypothetical protein
MSDVSSIFNNMIIKIFLPFSIRQIFAHPVTGLLFVPYYCLPGIGLTVCPGDYDMLMVRHKAIDRNNTVGIADHIAKMIYEYGNYSGMNKHLLAIL